ncbi:histidine kinase [Desulfosarcina cetonica]|uniref:histidine kinase n=1 Tax=Desulfosarcina cetonica TaxID=90730 RepID=UPI00155D8E73|nr:histidine kinase [Desulfosarcina cetonica]
MRKPFMFGLRFKLTLLIEGMIVLLVLVTGVITTFREKKALEVELHKRGLALASDLAQFTTRPLLSRDLPTLRRFVNHSTAQEYVRYVMVVDPQGRVVMHSDLAEVGKRLDDLSLGVGACPGGYRRVSTHLPEPKEMHCDLAVPITVETARLGTIRLGYSYMAVEKEIDLARRQIVLIGVVTILIGGVIAYSLASFIAAPIKRMIAATEAVADGNLKPYLFVDRNDEVGLLSSSFNKMAAELEKHRLHLENLVRDRTVELETTNGKLKQEIVERELTQEKLMQSRERLRDLALHLQSIREEEAKRIAREIHDELGQTLTAIKFDLHWLDSKLSMDPGLLHEKIQKMSGLIDATAKTVRRIASELRPGILDDFGLSAAMEWQAREFADRVGIACAFTAEPETIVLDPKRSVAVFRIFQEALTNVARHARATAVTIDLTETETTLELVVRDNGIGISEEQILTSRSFGVIGMHERVNHLNGTFSIHGAPRTGTTVKVRIPKEKRSC